MSEQEPGSVPEEESTDQERPEPTSIEIAQACKDVLSEEDYLEIAAGTGLGHVFALLYEAGIEDPEAFLKERGILVT